MDTNNYDLNHAREMEIMALGLSHVFMLNESLFDLDILEEDNSEALEAIGQISSLVKPVLKGCAEGLGRPERSLYEELYRDFQDCAKLNDIEVSPFLERVLLRLADD